MLRRRARPPQAQGVPGRGRAPLEELGAPEEGERTCHCAYPYAYAGPGAPHAHREIISILVVMQNQGGFPMWFLTLRIGTLGKPLPNSGRRGCGPGADAELGENMRDMVSGRFRADGKRSSDLPIGTPIRQQPQYIPLPTRECDARETGRLGGCDDRAQHLVSL